MWLQGDELMAQLRGLFTELQRDWVWILPGAAAMAVGCLHGRARYTLWPETPSSWPDPASRTLSLGNAGCSLLFLLGKGTFLIISPSTHMEMSLDFLSIHQLAGGRQPRRLLVGERRRRERGGSQAKMKIPCSHSRAMMGC